MKTTTAITPAAQANADEFRKNTGGDPASIERIASLIEKVSIRWPTGWGAKEKEEYGRSLGKDNTKPYNDPTKIPFWKANLSNPPMGNLPQPNAGAGNNQTNVNASTTIQIQGSTLQQMQDIVTKAKDKFGEELLASLQEANRQFI